MSLATKHSGHKDPVRAMQGKIGSSFIAQAQNSWRPKLLRHSRLVLAGFLFVVLTGCPFVVADASLVVVGKTVDAAGERYPDCMVKLLIPTTKEVIDSKRTSGEFRVSFVVSPYGDKYLVSVSCSGSPNEFVSEEVGGRRDPFDIGVIVL